MDNYGYVSDDIAICAKIPIMVVISAGAALEARRDELSRHYFEECEQIRNEAESRAVEPNNLEEACRIAAADIINLELKRRNFDNQVTHESILIYEIEDELFKKGREGGIASPYGGFAKVFRLPEEMPYIHKVFWYITFMAHELVHLAPSSYVSFKLDGSGNAVETFSHGYTFLNYGKVEYPLRGNALDEASVALFCMQACQNAVDLIRERFGVDVSEYASVYENFIYPEEMRFLEYINTIVANVRKSCNYESVLGAMITGLFTCKKMHLRDIDHTFGPGAMRILSLWGASELKSIDEIKQLVQELYGESITFHNNLHSLNDYIKYYFETFNVDEKLEIEELLLAPKELEKVRRRRAQVEKNILEGGIRSALSAIIV